MVRTVRFFGRDWRSWTVTWNRQPIPGAIRLVDCDMAGLEFPYAHLWLGDPVV